MKLGFNGFKLIKRVEGLRTQAYQDDGGIWTIGYGHTSHVKEGDECTGVQAETYLLSDIEEAEESVNSDVFAAINQHQFDALCSFVFNIGGSFFKKSTLLKQLNNGNSLYAANEFSKWIYVNKQIDPGLVRRRALEKILFLTPMDETYDI